jgi:creatinine amidohydrolase
MEVLLKNLTRYDVTKIIKKVKAIIIPTGSLEQHGLHLPLEHDTASVYYISCAAAKKLYPKVLVCPPIPIGLSPHHLKWPLAITLESKTFVEILIQTCKSINHYGIKNIIILNGHGGNNAIPLALEGSNIGPLDYAVTEARKLGLRVTCSSYPDLIPPQKCKEILDITTGVGHAGEFETSIGLYIYPEKVKMEKFRQVDYISAGSKAATRDKGKQLVEEAVKGVTSYFKDFIENKINEIHYKPFREL